METRQRIVWADLLRLIAIFMVICSHSADPFNVSAEARLNPEFNFWGSAYGSFFRPCVPLFAMLTGMLLLPVKQSMGAFYKKRITRVLVPLVIWSVSYNLFPWIVRVVGLDSSVVTAMFPYAGEHPDQSLAGCLHNVVMSTFNFGTYTVPLWYIYMLIGLYLYLPIFSAWVSQASKKQKQLFLCIWGVSLFLPYCQEYLVADIWGACAWNEFGMLYYFAGFNGYLLLGHYLKEYPLASSVAKTIALSSVLLIVGYVITYSGFSHMSSTPGISEHQLELYWFYCSPQVVMMTVAWFLLIQRVHIKHPAVVSALKNLTQCGLGIYLIHYFVVGFGYIVIDKVGVPISLRIPATALFVFAVAWSIVALCYKVCPKVSKWVMG